MRILVTGGAGFVGSNLCEKLLKQGHTVACLDNLQTGQRKNVDYLFEKYRPKFTWIQKDVIDDDMSFYYDMFEQIYHLACPASPPKYQKDPIHTMMTNVVGTKNILECARQSNENCRVLLTSTSEIYGDPLEHPQKETYRGNVNPNGPRACYDEGKRAAETLMYDYQRLFGVEVRVARIFNTYGPGMDLDDGRVVTNFIKQIIKNEPVTIYGSGEQTRSLCYIDDQVEGLIALMNSDYSNPVNIGNPNELTINQLAQEIHELVDTDVPLDYARMELPKDDPTRRCPDISVAMKELGWSPKVGRREGLMKTILYAMSQLNDDESN